MSNTSIEISVRGEWVRVQSLNVDGLTLVVTGKWIRVASVHDEFWLPTEVEDPELCIRKLKEQASSGFRADVFTFAQKLPETLPKYDYLLEWDSIAAIHLETFKGWWDRLPQETRKNVRRAEKRGVEVRVQEFGDDLIRGIGEVNNDSPLRQRRRNAHYGKTFEQLRRDYSSFIDRSDFICAYLGDEMIGFLKLVHGRDVSSILNLTPKASHSDKRPANVLIAKAVELCQARGNSYLTYGMYNYGHKHDSPLREFKIRNGFEEQRVPRFYAPLNAWGTICIKLGLYRGFLGIVPSGMITLGLGARAKWCDLKVKWYDGKKSQSRCSSTPERPNCNRQMER